MRKSKQQNLKCAKNSNS